LIAGMGNCFEGVAKADGSKAPNRTRPESQAGCEVREKEHGQRLAEVRVHGLKSWGRQADAADLDEPAEATQRRHNSSIADEARLAKELEESRTVTDLDRKTEAEKTEQRLTELRTPGLSTWSKEKALLRKEHKPKEENGQGVAPPKQTSPTQKGAGMLLKEQRLADEKKKAEEEEQQRIDEARQSAEENRLAQEKRLAEEQRLLEEKKRLADEKKRAEERRLSEEKRLAQEHRLLEDKKRLAEEKMREEERRLAEEKRLAEEERLLEEKKRLAEEKKREEERRLAEEMRRAAATALPKQRAADDKRLADESDSHSLAEPAAATDQHRDVGHALHRADSEQSFHSHASDQDSVRSFHSAEHHSPRKET